MLSAAQVSFIRRALFAGCRTGRILKAGLGEEWCRKIVWEEASLEVGGNASSVFPADSAHILAVIEGVKPAIILALGKIAADALTKLLPALDYLQMVPQLIVGPHPTARGVDTVSALRDIRAKLDKMA